MGGVRGSEAERGRAKNGRDSLASSRALERLRGKRKKARETKRRPIGGGGTGDSERIRRIRRREEYEREETGATRL
jgi:hypothetical protein